MARMSEVVWCIAVAYSQYELKSSKLKMRAQYLVRTGIIIPLVSCDSILFTSYCCLLRCLVDCCRLHLGVMILSAIIIYNIIYVGGSSKIQTLSHDSTSIEIEVYNNGKTHRLLKLVFFIYKCVGILLVYILSTGC